jgi:hypothetical protein
MSGQRGFIYLNKRPKLPEKWRDISCRTLDFAIKVFMVLQIMVIVAGLLWWWLR